MADRNHPRFNFLKMMIGSLFVLALVSPVFGQQAATATIEGIVADPNGAVVPAAKVSIKNVDTGLTREITTDNSGIYRITALPPGTYQINASGQGFAENKYGPVTLTVGQKLNLDLALRVNVSEAVEITSQAPVLETTRTNVAGSVGEQQVRSLPVNGRNFLDFVSLTAGVVRDSSRLGDLSFGGQRGTFNSVQIDGVDNNNNFFGQSLGRTGSGRAPYQFSQDAVQEFQVNTSGFSAEFGRAAGGAINVITKSGTNQFHGVGFEFFRDASLNAKRPNFIALRNGLVPILEPYHFHQFGGNLGGPVKKDTAFFFFNYDGQRNTRPNLVSLGQSAPADAASQAGLQRILPLVQNYTLGFNQDVYLGKFDWQISSENRLAFRYNGQRFKGRNLESGGATSAQEHTGNSNVTTNTYTVSLNTAFTPRFLNEFRTQLAFDKEPGFANTDNAEATLQQGGTVAFVFGRNFFSPRATNEDKVQFVDNVSYFAGKHSLKGGVDFIIEKIENFFPGNFGGRYFFQSLNGYAEFANHFDPANAGFRSVTRYQQSFAGVGTTGPLTRPDYNDYGFFIQDDWRATSKLSLSVGVRYDTQVMAKPTTFNPDPRLAAAGVSTTQFNNDFDNLAPRFGFAWNPKEKLVVRGGYGLFFGRTPSIMIGTAHSNNGVNVIGITLNNVRLPFTYPSRFATLADLQSAFGAAQPATPDIYVFDKNYQQPYTQQGSLGFEYGLTKDTTVGASYLYVKGTNLTRTRDLNLPTPVPATIRIQGGPDDGKTVTFLRHPGATAPARPIAGFGRISQFEATADSTYNALSLTFKKRLSRNFLLDASYVWSKVLDNVPDQTSVVVGGGDDAKQAQQTFLLSDDRGHGNADTPHRFVLNSLWQFNYFNDLKGPARALLGGWEFSGILQISSNQPLSELLGADLNNDGNNRTDRTPGVGRNTIRGDVVETVDLRVTKSFGFKEDKFRVQLIGEMFNAFNHTNIAPSLAAYLQNNRYSVPGINTANATLLYRTNFLEPRSVPIDGQRIGQIALKLIF
ncbi:MAG TPA: TonB-dependent receptor [Blastocatellia bacterium]|nr:TonB-dependent receptor [Blastocatellia bacterium]